MREAGGDGVARLTSERAAECSRLDDEQLLKRTSLRCNEFSTSDKQPATD